MTTDPYPLDCRATDTLDRALVLAGVIVWRIDLQRQRAHCNAVGFQALGRPQSADGISLEELRGLVHPDDLNLVEDVNQRALAGNEVVDQVIRFRYADGSWRHVLTRRAAERDSQGQAVGFSGVSIDVSELQAERAQVQRLLEQTSLAARVLGVGFWSNQADAAGRHAMHGDAQLQRIYGCQASQMPKDTGQWLREFVHPDDRAWVSQRMRLADIAQEPLVDIRYRLNDKNGQLRSLHSWTHRTQLHGHLAIFGMELDVTDNQQAQAQRQREQQREQFAIEAAAVGIWERDVQGQVVYWNETMFHQRACTSVDPRHPDQIMVDTTHPEDRKVLVRAFGQHLSSSEPYREELRLCLPDGTQRWILAQGRPLFDAAGRVVGMAGINLDITAQKTAALLQEDKRRAEQASRDKSIFMARMSHELRTPMNAVLGFSQLMRDEASEPLSPPQLQRLGLVEAAGHQLLALIDNLLEISQRADVSLAPPAPQQARAEPAPALTNIAPRPCAMLRILCVEDNPVNLLLVREVLALRPQVQLRCAEDGHSGVAAALQEPPDVLLLDLQLPDISGHEVFKRLHCLPQMTACRFIALSADAMPESVEAAQAAGFHDYWTKPIQFDRFLAHIDQMVSQRTRSG